MYREQYGEYAYWYQGVHVEGSKTKPNDCDMNYSVKIILLVLIIIMHYFMLVLNSLKYLQLINVTHQIFLSTPSSLWEYMAQYSHLTLL